LDDILLKEAASDGYRNFVYGAVTQAEHDNCRELGVDGIITDFPLLVQDT
jgi:glycerophosphoryl diester phosphodiesterase